MRRTFCWAAVALSVVGSLAGCGGGDVPKRVTQERPKVVALDRIKTILSDYALGTTVGSETIEFDALVQELKIADPAKALLVHDAFESFKKKPSQKVEAEARALLAKL